MISSLQFQFWKIQCDSALLYCCNTNGNKNFLNGGMWRYLVILRLVCLYAWLQLQGPDLSDHYPHLKKKLKCRRIQASGCSAILNFLKRSFKVGINFQTGGIPTEFPRKILFLFVQKNHQNILIFYIIYSLFISHNLFFITIQIKKNSLQNKTFPLFNTTFSLFYTNYYTFFFFLTKQLTIFRDVMLFNKQPLNPSWIHQLNWLVSLWLPHKRRRKDPLHFRGNGEELVIEFLRIL